MHKGKTERGTLCGGVASLCLSGLILAYFCMKALDVASFSDLAINSYTIHIDRSNMKESPINLLDYK